MAEAQGCGTAYLNPPLSDSRSEIRLLEILPRSADAAHPTLECQLSRCSLKDKPPYAALSYVWGNPADSKSILVNGYEVRVTANLADALYHLRDEASQSLVWIDAICINQQDDNEKSQQVRRMARIYQQAKIVMAWLGTEDDTIERTFQKMREVAQMARSLRLEVLRSPNIWTWTEWTRVEACRRLMQGLCHNPDFEHGDLGLIMSLLERPYWRRLWVIQELSLAKKAMLFCGRKVISWDDFQAASMALGLIRYAIPDLNRYEDSVSLLDICYPFGPCLINWNPPSAVVISARIQAGGAKAMSLWNMLECTCNDTGLEVLDPRDRVYALHGLLTDQDRDAIRVDYSLSCPDLYLQATKYLLAQCGPQLLVFSGMAYKTALRTLPSWAVDWSCTRARTEGVFVRMAGELLQPYQFQAIAHDKIALTGAAVGRITEVVPYSGLTGDLPWTVAQLGCLVLQKRHFRDQKSLRDIWISTCQTIVQRTGELLASILIDDELYEIFIQRRAPNDHKVRIGGVASTLARARTYLEKGPEPWSTFLSETRAVEEGLRMWEYELSLRPPSVKFITDNGLIGTTSVPAGVQVGDVLHAFRQCGYPFILRPGSKSDGSWTLVGQAFVGEIMSLAPDNKKEEGIFTLRKFWKTDPVVEEVILC